MTTFTKVAKAATSFTKGVKAATTYVKEGISAYLLIESGFVLLRENGDRLLILPTGVGAKHEPDYTKIAK